MRSLIVGLFGVAMLWAGSAAAAPEPLLEPAPAWVKPLGPVKYDSPSTSAPYRQLRLDQQIHFGPEGDSVYVESVVRIQNAQGLSVMGSVALPWNPDSGTLTVHRLEIRRGDKVIDVLADQAFTVLRRENRLEYAMLDGVLTATIQPEGIEVGDIVTLAYTLTSKDGVTGDYSEDLIQTPASTQIDERQLRVLWDPKAKPIRWRLVQGLNPPKVGKTRAGETELIFDLKSQKPFKAPNGAPNRYRRERGIELTQFKDWAELSALMSPLYDKAAIIKPGSRLHAEVDKIRAASNDPVVQAGLALSLVQERTRYVYLGMDSGNLTPAGAESTWARRYGDCKAKTALLMAILRELGIKAEAAIVSSEDGDGMNDRLPIVGLFDHVIVRAEIGGKTYWLDGTRNGDSRLEEVTTPAFFWALPLRASGGQLEALKIDPVVKPQLTVLIDIDASGGLYVKAPTTASHVFRGDLAMVTKAAADAAPPEELEKAWKAYWQAAYPFIDIDTVDSAYDAETGEMRLTMTGKANMDWEEINASSATRYLSDGYLLGGKVSFEREKDSDNIDAPYAVGHPFHAYYRETIRLPDDGKGFSTDGADVDQVVGGMAFYRKTEIKDGVFIMESRGRSLKAEFPASQAKAIEKEMAELAEVKVYLVAPTSYRWTTADRASRIATMDEVIAEDPESGPAYRGRGWLYAENKDYVRAEADLTTALGLKGADSSLYTMRAGVRLKQGKTEAAMSDFATARDKADNESVSFNNLCWEQATNGVALEAALGDCDKALQIEPRSAAALDSRGFVLMRLGRWKDSIADYDKALSIRGDSAPSLFGRALAKAGAGDKAGASEDFAAARKLDPRIDEDYEAYGLKAPGSPSP